MWRLLQKNADFWTRDRSLTALLVYLFIYIFFTLPFIKAGIVHAVVSVVFFSFVLLSGVFTVMDNRPFKMTMIVLAILTFTIRCLAIIVPTPPLLLVVAIGSALFFAVLGMLITSLVFKEGEFNRHRIQGAVAVFLLIGLMWAYLYEATYLVVEQAFIFSVTSGDTFFARFLYFSFVTLTTIGFGDISPVHPLAKSLAMMEGLLGVLYPAIMIARLVSLEIDSRKK